MGRLLPRRPPVDRPEGVRLEAIDDEAADEVFDALSSRTARSILAAAYEDPAPASDLAEAADTSLQNARYHIDALCDAGLLDAADTWYSEQGREMTVYAPADESVVVVAGDTDTTGRLRDLLPQVLGGVALAAVASVAVELAVRRLGAASGRSAFSESGGGDAAVTTEAATPSAAGGVGGIPPGLLFFAGGLFVVLAGAAWWRLSRRER
jgi:DNA-binding transcriptional ArsR family regulator